MWRECTGEYPPHEGCSATCLPREGGPHGECCAFQEQGRSACWPSPLAGSKRRGNHRRMNPPDGDDRLRSQATRVEPVSEPVACIECGVSRVWCVGLLQPDGADKLGPLPLAGCDSALAFTLLRVSASHDLALVRIHAAGPATSTMVSATSSTHDPAQRPHRYLSKAVG